MCTEKTEQEVDTHTSQGALIKAVFCDVGLIKFCVDRGTQVKVQLNL